MLRRTVMTLTACAAVCAAANPPPVPKDAKGGASVNFTLSSAAFSNGQPLPIRYTGFDADISPPLKWSDPPQGTRSFVIICDDPDAPTGDWVHWVLYDIPPATRSLAENQPRTDTLFGSAVQGINDFREVGYWGPATPPGKPHRYFFRIFAVDKLISLPLGATKRMVLNAIEGHVLANAEIHATFRRP